MKNIYLISNVINGGKTYLEYLLPVLNALRNKYNCIVLQTNVVGISKHEAEKVLNHPVQEVGLEFIARLESQVIIANDAIIGALLSESNFSIFIAHGNVGMPVKDKYYFADLISYWDTIVSSSRSLSDLINAGLQLYRRDRNTLPERYSRRSDLRQTTTVSTLPVKVPAPFSSAPEVRQTSEEHTFGLLPTQIGICPDGASLYESMNVVINTVKVQVPHAKFILRPYMTDFDHPYVKEMCEQLCQYPWITIDNTKESSKEFYQRCDNIITDASSGGVSFMLNTGRLPIYYVPEVSDDNPIVKTWLERMGGYLPIARNSDELKDLVFGFELLTREQSYSIYKNFYESEYNGQFYPNEVFQDLVQKKHESDYSFSSIDSFGELTGSRFKNPDESRNYHGF
jgi:hypothetical protein